MAKEEKETILSNLKLNGEDQLNTYQQTNIHISEQNYLSNFEIMNDSFSHSNSIFNDIWLSICYTYRNIIHRPRNFIIGMISVIFLILFSGSIMLSISKLSYILLRLGELNTGEVDMFIQGNNKENYSFLNFTKMKSSFNNISEIKGVAPRWVFPVKIFKPIKNSTKRCINLNNLSAIVNLLIIDMSLEEKIGIGRGWRHTKATYAEAHVLQSVLDFLNIYSNNEEFINIEFSIQEIIKNFNLQNNNIFNKSNTIQNILNAKFPVKVLDGLENADGKYPSNVGNIMIMDYKEFLPAFIKESCFFPIHNNSSLSTYALPSSPSSSPSPLFMLNNPFILSTIINSIQPLDYVPILLVLFKDRREMYYLSDEEQSTEMIQRSNSIMYKTIGIDFNGIVHFPLIEILNKFKILKSLLISFFSFIVIGIIVLCILLFFSLFQINTNERQFEFAMMRILGMKKLQIILLFIVEILSFIIPSIIISIPLLISIHILMEFIIQDFTKAPPRYLSISFIPIILSIVLGLVLPFISGWIPILNTVGNNLHFALNSHRYILNEVKIIIIRLEKLGFSFVHICISLCLIILGFIIYYLIPLSFLFENLLLFFFLINIIIIIMVIGISMLMLIIEPFIESFFLNLILILFKKDKNLLTIIKKNIYTHRIYNSKTYIMLLLSVSSIISSSIIFIILSTTSAQMFSIVYGSDIAIISSSFNIPLYEKELNSFLDKQRGIIIEDYSYYSFPLNTYPHITYFSKLMTVIGISRYISVIAVSKNYLNTVFPDYIIEDSRDINYSYNYTNDGKYDVINSIYVDNTNNITDMSINSNSVTGLSTLLLKRNISKKLLYIIPGIIGSSIKNSLGLNVGDSLLLEYEYKILDVIITTRFKIKLRALMKRLSGFPDMSTPVFKEGKNQLLISQSFFKILLQPWKIDFNNNENIITEDIITEIRQEKLFIRLRQNLNIKERFKFINQIKSYMDLKYHSIIDTKIVLNNMNDIRQFIMYFFYFTAFICLCLSTLMLWITFIANIRLNSQMIGILRALGCRKWQIIRITLYEAVSLVFSAFFLGLVIGCIIGLTLSLQLTSLMVLPFQFTIPYMLIGILFGLCILSAIIGSMLALKSIDQNHISLMIRGI